MYALVLQHLAGRRGAAASTRVAGQPLGVGSTDIHEIVKAAEAHIRPSHAQVVSGAGAPSGGAAPPTSSGGDMPMGRIFSQTESPRAIFDGARHRGRPGREQGFHSVGRWSRTRTSMKKTIISKFIPHLLFSYYNYLFIVQKYDAE